MLTLLLIFLGWIAYFASFLVGSSVWDDRLTGIAFGFFIGSFLSMFIKED